MKKYRHLLRWTCITVVCALFLTACAQAPPYPGQTESPHLVILIHPETTFQIMTGFGAGFNTSIFINAITNDIDRMRAYDLLYEPQYNGVQLNIVRLVVSDSAQKLIGLSPLYAHGLKYDWAGDSNTQSIWSAIQPILDRTRPIIYAVPFTPPVSWKIATAQNPYNPNCNPLLNPHACGGKLDPNHYQDYAEYLVDFLEYYHKILKVDIDVLSIQNEPEVSAPWPSCIWTGQELRDFLKILKPLLTSRGLNTKIMLSEGTSWTGAAAHLGPTVLDASALSLLDIMASHSYGDPFDNGRALFAGAWEKYKLPVWMSEMSLMDLNNPTPDDPTIDAALTIAGYIHRDISQARASAWVYCFAIFTSAFKGSMGVLSPADEPGKEGQLIIPKRFWAMANYSQFVGPRWKVMKIEPQLLGITVPDTPNTGFISPKGDGFVIVSYNLAVGSKKVTYNFGKWSIGPEVDSYCTSGDYDLTPNVVPITQITNNSFTTSLPAKSVVTFKGSLIKPKPTLYPKEKVIIKPESIP